MMSYEKHVFISSHEHASVCLQSWCTWTPISWTAVPAAVGRHVMMKSSRGRPLSPNHVVLTACYAITAAQWTVTSHGDSPSHQRYAKSGLLYIAANQMNARQSCQNGDLWCLLGSLAWGSQLCRVVLSSQYQWTDQALQQLSNMTRTSTQPRTQHHSSVKAANVGAWQRTTSGTCSRVKTQKHYRTSRGTPVWSLSQWLPHDCHHDDPAKIIRRSVLAIFHAEFILGNIKIYLYVLYSSLLKGHKNEMLDFLI